MERSPSESESLWDKTAPYYHQLADLLRVIAGSHHNVTIDPATLERWRQTMGLMREVDTAADTTHDHSQILEKLQTFDPFRQRYPALSPEATDNVHEKIIQRARDILSLGQQIAQTTSSDHYIRLRAREGMYTAHFFADTASPEVIDQPGFGAFLHTLRALGASASLLDSSVDLGKDYRSRQSSLSPTIAHRRQLLGAALHYRREIIQPTRHRPVIRELARAAYLQTRRKVFPTG